MFGHSVCKPRSKYYLSRFISLFILGAIVFLLSLTLDARNDTRLELPKDNASDGKAQSTTSAPKFEPILFKSSNTVLLSGVSKSFNTLLQNGGRLVFIGDIHGCFEELLALLAKVEYNPNHDHIITTGDMVNKGPDSASVLDFLRENKASCVLGNHDNKILQLEHENRHFAAHGHGIVDGMVPLASERRVAGSLSASGVAYLQSCPTILHIGKIHETDFVVAHAGIVPSIPLLHQNAEHVMNMRIIDLKTLVPSAAHHAEGSVHWFQLWNTYQGLSLAERREFAAHERDVDEKVMTVVYGHDAKKGLQLHRHTRGLDSKCVAGGKLTALVLSEASNEEIVQVDCKEYHK